MCVCVCLQLNLYMMATQGIWQNERWPFYTRPELKPIKTVIKKKSLHQNDRNLLYTHTAFLEPVNEIFNFTMHILFKGKSFIIVI